MVGVVDTGLCKAARGDSIQHQRLLPSITLLDWAVVSYPGTRIVDVGCKQLGREADMRVARSVAKETAERGCPELFEVMNVQRLFFCVLVDPYLYTSWIADAAMQETDAF